MQNNNRGWRVMMFRTMGKSHHLVGEIEPSSQQIPPLWWPLAMCNLVIDIPPLMLILACSWWFTKQYSHHTIPERWSVIRNTLASSERLQRSDLWTKSFVGRDLLFYLAILFAAPFGAVLASIKTMIDDKVLLRSKENFVWKIHNFPRYHLLGVFSNAQLHSQLLGMDGQIIPWHTAIKRRFRCSAVEEKKP